jgi:SAM-dependent methyltransferase
MCEAVNDQAGAGGKTMLNLGCGGRFHPGWVNVDRISTGRGVRVLNLNQQLPFRDGTFDVVYHSHLLEHFSPAAGMRLLQECYRICRSPGIIRVAVPDLERSAAAYLDILHDIEHGAEGMEPQYDWIMLELFDQAVRTKPGGEMAGFLQHAPAGLAHFLDHRIGTPFRDARLSHTVRDGKSAALLRRGKGIPSRVRELFLVMLCGLIWGRSGIRVAREVIFRRQGEVHKWMYDRFSVCRALREAGFAAPRICRADESRIPGWSAFHLDTNPDGTVYKADSIYCEAEKAV